MTDLQQRLRRFADEGARQASPPGVEAAVRRGRRRRKHLVGAVGLGLVAVLAGGLGVGWVMRDSATEPAGPDPAPAPSSTRPAEQPLLRAFPPARGTVVARGTHRGFHWRLVVRRTKLPHQQRELNLLFETDADVIADSGAGTLEPVTLSVGQHGPPNGEAVISGAVTRRAAVVRLQLEGGRAPPAPVDLEAIDAGPDVPARFFVVFVPPGSALREIVLLDGQSRTLCHQRLGPGRPLGLPVHEPGSCL
jgi:hypothetical protein